MRVVHVTPYFAPAFRYGGPPRSIFGLCRALQQAGVEVEVVTTAADGPFDLPASPPEGDTYEGVPVRYVAPAFPRRFFGAAIRAPIDAALRDADLCHVHGLWNVPAWTASRLARRRPIPYVLSPRGMLQPAARRRGALRKAIAWRLLDRQAVMGAARLHATAEDEARVLRGLVASCRVVTIPNGVEPDAAVVRDGRVRAELGLPADVPLVLFLGRLHPIKRIDLLAHAVATLRTDHPGAQLVLAGPDEHGYLARIGGALAPLGPAVHRVGHVDGRRKWALLAEASALVLCSDSESFGLSVAEAMACGTPVVVTRTCPWEEVDREGCGFWVPQNAAAIAAALRTIVGQPELAREMGRRGARLAARRYSWRAAGLAMAACYADALGARAASPAVA